MSLILEPLYCLLTLGILLLFIMALLSPFEALSWWAGWSKNDLESDLNILLKKSDQLNENSTPDQFDKFLHDLDYFIFDLDDYISGISNAMKSLGDIGNSLYEIHDFIHKNFISNDNCKK